MHIFISNKNLPNGGEQNKAHMRSQWIVCSVCDGMELIHRNFTQQLQLIKIQRIPINLNHTYGFILITFAELF